MARRMAISRDRLRARASNKFATLAHAINNTRPASDMSVTTSELSYGSCWKRDCNSVCTAMEWLWLVAG